MVSNGWPSRLSPRYIRHPGKQLLTYNFFKNRNLSQNVDNLKVYSLYRAHNTIPEYTPNATHPTPATYYSEVSAGIVGLLWRADPWYGNPLSSMAVCVFWWVTALWTYLSWHWEHAKPANILFLPFLQWVLWFWKALKILGYVCYGLDGFMGILLTVAALLDGLKITLHMCRNAVISRAVAAAHQIPAVFHGAVLDSERLVLGLWKEAVEAVWTVQSFMNCRMLEVKRWKERFLVKEWTARQIQ